MPKGGYRDDDHDEFSYEAPRGEALPGAFPERPAFPPPVFRPPQEHSTLYEDEEYEYYLDEGQSTDSVFTVHDDDQFEYYVEQEEVHTKEGDDYDVVEEIVYVQDGEDGEVPVSVLHRAKGTDSLKVSKMNNAKLEKLRREGVEKSMIIGKDEAWRDILILAAKWIGSIIALILMVSGTYFFIMYSYDSLERRERDAMAKRIADGGKDIFDSAHMWRLLPNTANNLAKEFYLATGSVQGFSTMVDLMLKGTVSIEGHSQAFYCIKKRDGRVFLRIGSGAEEKSYFVDVRGRSWRLPSGGMSGERRELPWKESERIRALVSFDDALNRRAFPPDSSNAQIMDSLIYYEDKTDFDGQITESISTYDIGERRVTYFIDPETFLIVGQFTSHDGVMVKINYSKYEALDKDLTLPTQREIFIDDEPYATVSIEMAVKNREMLFPQ